MTLYPQPPYPEQHLEIPGTDKALNPKADHGETSYKGSGKLTRRKAVQNTPLKRAGQPVELAPVYVLLASQDSSYMSGSTVQVTGGTPTI